MVKEGRGGEIFDQRGLLKGSIENPGIKRRKFNWFNIPAVVRVKLCLPVVVHLLLLLSLMVVISYLAKETMPTYFLVWHWL